MIVGIDLMNQSYEKSVNLIFAVNVFEPFFQFVAS